MKKAYNVTFRWGNNTNTYCSNIALAERLTEIDLHYYGKEIIAISEATESDLREAKLKNKPIIDCTLAHA